MGQGQGQNSAEAGGGLSGHGWCGSSQAGTEGGGKTSGSSKHSLVGREVSHL